jgi:hypothetical protein
MPSLSRSLSAAVSSATHSARRSHVGLGHARLRRITRAGILALALGFGAAGCADLDQARALRSRASELQQQFHDESQAWEDRLAHTDPRDAGAADTRAALARARAREAAAAAAVEQVDQVIREAASPDSPTGQTVGAVAPFLPEPVRLPLLLGSALVFSLARAAQLKRATASIAGSLQKAIDEDEQFAARFKAHANTFRSIQTPAAKRIVDHTTGDRPLLSLPI